MKYEVFKEKFGKLLTIEKIDIYNDYCLNHGYLEDAIQDFDEEFFSTYFSNPMEAARATFFGNIQSWNDDYIRINSYGNLESLTEYDALKEIDEYLGEIYEHEDTWSDYIEDEEDEEYEE